MMRYVKMEKIVGNPGRVQAVQPECTGGNFATGAAPPVRGGHAMGQPGLGLRRRKAGRERRSRPCILIVALLGAGGMSGTAPGQVCNYEVVATLYGEECSPGDFASFIAWAIDEQGNVAGSSSCTLNPHAAVWTGGPIAELLSGPPSVLESTAFDLLEPDHVVGRALPSGQNIYRAAYWLESQGTLLPVLPNANTAQALGINRDLVIVGMSNNTTVAGELKAFRWDAGQIEALVLPFGTKSWANDINLHGQVTGWMGTSPLTDAHAYVWSDGAVLDLGVIPGGNGTRGTAINSHGHVAGDGQVPDGASTFGKAHAFFWDGSAMLDLGTLPGRTQSNTNDLNDAGQVVGRSLSPNSAAFIWEQGVMHDLNDRIIIDMGSTTVESAIAIDNQGWIVAGTSLGVRILLKPVNSSPGDIDNNCEVNVSDLLLLLGDWGRTDSFADTNGDGIVNVLDLLQVLADWG